MEPKSLHSKLLEIRKSIDYLQKDQRGKTGKYIDTAVLLQRIRDKMDEVGVLLIPEISKPVNLQKVSNPTKNNPDQNDFMVDMVIDYTWIDVDTGKTLPVKWYATASHMTDPAQAFGSALTYTERYFLVKFFQIPTAEDDPEYFKQRTSAVEYITKEQIEKLDALIVEVGADKSKFLSFGNIKSLSDIVSSDYQNCINLLEAKRK